jgi:hypothetical protein
MNLIFFIVHFFKNNNVYLFVRVDMEQSHKNKTHSSAPALLLKPFYSFHRYRNTGRHPLAFLPASDVRNRDRL